MQHCDSDGQMMLFSLEEADEIYARPPKRKSGTLTLSTLISIPYFHLDLSKGHVDLFGCHYWEFRSPWQENGPPLNTGAAPREPVKCDLSSILERDPDERHDLSPKACLGTLHRAKERGKPLPERLEWALMAQAGLLPMNFQAAEMRAYHINRRDEDTDLYGVAGTLMATSIPALPPTCRGCGISSTPDWSGRRTSSSIRAQRPQRTEAGASASRSWKSRPRSQSAEETVWTGCCWRRSRTAGR